MTAFISAREGEKKTLVTERIRASEHNEVIHLQNPEFNRTYIMDIELLD